MTRISPLAVIGAAVAAVFGTTSAFAQVDTLSVVVPGSITTSTSIGAYGYVPSSTVGGNDTYYVANLTSSGAGLYDIRSIAVPPTGTPTQTQYIAPTAWTLFLKGGNANNGGGVEAANSMLINKTASGAIGAYSAGFVADQTSNGGVAATLTQRIYRYNLAKDTNGDASDEMTSLVTLAQMQGVVNSTSTSTGVGRQVALSTNSSTVYFTDSTSTFGGLWSVPSAGGTVSRLTTDGQNFEASVQRVGTVDRVILAGNATSGNAGGLDYYDTSAGTRGTALLASKLADFLETTAANITLSSSATDDAGNVYFLDTKAGSGTVPERRGLYRLDTSGHISKVFSYAERASALGVTTLAALPARFQTRAATVNGLPITQVSFQESSPSTSAIALANVYLPGDFNRDGLVNQTDVGLFKGKLTTHAVSVTNAVADSRYDLNGSNTIDWKDVKALQQFLPIKDGDADMNYAVDLTDLTTEATNYGSTSGKTWVQGDFTGDDAVNYADLLILVGNYDTKPTFPTLTVGGVFTQPFIDDYNRAIAAVVPEPTTLTALAGIATVAIRRRRKA